MDLTAMIVELGALLLEQLPDGRFVRTGPVPAWCQALKVPDVVSTGRPFRIEEAFPFLEVFLEEAEECWRGPPDGRERGSGFWTEIGKNGEEFHLEAAAMLVDGQHLVVVRRNERLFAQQQLVLQRARELHQANTKLIQEIEQKDVLAHCIVHDLAAPLHAILGALSLLSELPLSADGKKWTTLAVQAAHRQRELIRDILDVFASEYGSLTGQPEALTPVDLGRAIAQVVSEADPVARSRGAQIAAELSSGPWRVVAEEDRLVRAISNLVQNAFRHSPAGGRVSISVTREGHNIRINVDDEGPGVPVDVLPHLFERFATSGKPGTGSGLGLYFCRISVERWGGGIGYERRERGGSRFWLRLTNADAGRPHGEAAAGR